MANQPALDRLNITIEGVTERTISRLNDLIRDLQASGASEEAIRQRIKLELVGGPVLAEMRSFATARVPGFIGDMAFRFARDTLATQQHRIDEALAEVKKERLEAMTKEVKAADGTEKTRLQDIQDAYKRQGIDITAYQNELPEPPPDADLQDDYMWVAIVDSNTCSVCAGNHGAIKSLREWALIGEPRSGACVGEQNCRCILVPDNSLTRTDRQEIRDIGPLNIAK